MEHEAKNWCSFRAQNANLNYFEFALVRMIFISKRQNIIKPGRENPALFHKRFSIKLPMRLASCIEQRNEFVIHLGNPSTAING